MRDQLGLGGPLDSGFLSHCLVAQASPHEFSHGTFRVLHLCHLLRRLHILRRRVCRAVFLRSFGAVCTSGRSRRKAQYCAASQFARLHLKLWFTKTVLPTLGRLHLNMRPA